LDETDKTARSAPVARQRRQNLALRIQQAAARVEGMARTG